MPERGSKTSTVPVVWASFGILSARSKLFPVAIGHHVRILVVPIWPGDKSHSVEWRHSCSPRPAPKNSEFKNPLGKFSPRFFGIKTASSSLITFQRANLSTWSITHLCWCNWRTVWRKNAAGRSPRGYCSCTTVPRLTGLLQPRRNWPNWASIVLITHPIL